MIANQGENGSAKQAEKTDLEKYDESIQQQFVADGQDANKKDAKQERDLWVRMPKESAKAYEAFSTYRDMGTNRTITKTATELGKLPPLLFGWSRRYDWVSRVYAYDIEQDRIYFADLKELRRKSVGRHAEGLNVFQRLSMLAVKAKYGDVMSGDEEAIKKIEDDVKAGKISLDDIRKLFIESAKFERTILGQPSEVLESQHTGGLTDDTDRKPAIPVTHKGRIDQALELLNGARAKTILEADTKPS